MPKDARAKPGLTVAIGQHSSAGQKPENQDFHGALIPAGQMLALKGIVLAVADGISSSAISREAAELSVKALLTDYYATPDAWTARTAATRVITATNAWLFAQNRALSDINAGRVCTLSTLILKGREGHILHLGDSRVSRFDGASLEPLTEDHRVVLSASESYLGRAMGMAGKVQIDYRRLRLRVGDVFLLASDGVHQHVSAKTVKQAMEAPSLDEAAERIVQAALDAGSDDNLTVQIVRIESLPEADDMPGLDAAGLPLPRQVKPGDVIDGFRLLREIHTTARSRVFLASSPDGSKVAFKVPSAEMAQDAAYLNRFVFEEWIARRIASPHVLAAAKPPEQRTALYVVTEFVEGTTLRQWITDNPKPPLGKVRDIATQLAAGLRAFHRREMLHQDLRPENVMIDSNGTVKIIDLGSTAVAGVEEAAPGTLGELPGTFQYTAPEYLSGEPASWRSDQYALGAILYEMLTGRLPYGPAVARITNRREQMQLSYLPARDAGNGLPAFMDAALRRACHPDPLRRYDALSEFVQDLKTPGPTFRATRHVPLAERNPVRFWQGVSAALALVCLMLAYHLTN
ncbi:protein kinase domain-containing protein [Tropicibacter sp. S64]|uniref:protein kinase domain-containing protein n=1 Tax=Tropicibacter sp. S64 TaxID=3415122 RepID=UPI003C7B040F